MRVKVTAMKGKEKKLYNFYPFLYKDETKKVSGEYKNGEIVEVVTEENTFVGLGYINENSHVLVRMLTLNDEKIDKAFIKSRIKAAYEKRKHILKETNSMRIFYSEADGLPGLIVDMFEKYLSVQFRTPGIEVYKDEIIKSLKEVVKPKGIYERSDTETRVHEGVEQQSGLIMGDIPEKIVLEDNGLKYNVDIVNGQKTGFFLDQRESRKFIRRYLDHTTRFLDVFSSSGGFSMAALKENCLKVVAVDKSAEALKLAQENYTLNEFTGNFQTVEGDAFALLKTMAVRNEKYDVIVLDPPSLIKKKEDNFRGRDFFFELSNDAFKLLDKNGILGICTCAYHISLQDLIETTRMAASDNKRKLEVLGVTYQPEDHPWILHIPETLYLKCLWVKAVDL